MSRVQPPRGSNIAHTKYAKSGTGPHRGLVRLELRRHRRIISLGVQRDAEAARLRLKHAIEHNRRDANTNRQADLRHRLDQRTRDALLVRVRDLGDEQRASREREVHPERGEKCRREAERPV